MCLAGVSRDEVAVFQADYMFPYYFKIYGKITIEKLTVSLVLDDYSLGNFKFVLKSLDTSQNCHLA